MDQLPTGPDWKCQMVEVVGDLVDEDGSKMVEEVELWQRDPIECLRELMGNPAWKDDMAYEPEMVFTDEEGNNRIYDEACTGDWWWKKQVRGI